MLNNQIIITVIGLILTFFGILNGYKYHWSAQAIRKAGTSKGHSRKFINVSLINDIFRIIYCIIILDWWLIISTIFAIIFMIEHWIYVYLFYPFRNKNKIGFKRPNVFKYTWNSLLPNSLRKKL